MENGNKATQAEIMAMRLANSVTLSIDRGSLNGTNPQEYVKRLYDNSGVQIERVVTEEQGPYVVVYAWGPEQPQQQAEPQSANNNKQLHF